MQDQEAQSAEAAITPAMANLRYQWARLLYQHRKMPHLKQGVSPQHIPELTRRLFGLHVLLMLHLVEHQGAHLEELHGIELADEAAKAARKSLQLLEQAGVVVVG